MPVTLALFIERRDLFLRLAVGEILLLSAAVSLPFVLLSTWIWYQLFAKAFRQAQFGRQPSEQDELVLAVQVEDPMEASLLFAGAATANIVLYAVALAAYFTEISLSSTYVTIGLWGISIVVAISVLKMGLQIAKAVRERRESDT
jgi:hypothetical protein